MAILETRVNHVATGQLAVQELDKQLQLLRYKGYTLVIAGRKVGSIVDSQKEQTIVSSWQSVRQ